MFLLDTAVFLRMVTGEVSRVPHGVRTILEDKKNDLLLSVVSAWEIAIKYSIKKLHFVKNPELWLPDMVEALGLDMLPVQTAHVLAVSELPFAHRDPFDRLLAVQARIEDYTFITPDPIFKEYDVRTLW